MNDESKNFDGNLPEGNDTQKPASSNSSSASFQASSGGEQKKQELKDMAATVCLTIYQYVGELKSNNHTSLGNLVFQETMKMAAAATLASESIGRERFFENLEDGFYSSGRLLVYLNFAESLKVHDELRQAITETVLGIHKIFAASVKTVRSKQPKMAVSQVSI